MEALVQSSKFSWKKRAFFNKIGGESIDISRKKSFLQGDIKGNIWHNTYNRWIFILTGEHNGLEKR